jgi:hypothetical protein
MIPVGATKLPTSVLRPAFVLHKDVLSNVYPPPLGQSIQPRFTPAAHAELALNARRVANTSSFFFMVDLLLGTETRRASQQKP